MDVCYTEILAPIHTYLAAQDDVSGLFEALRALPSLRAVKVTAVRRDVTLTDLRGCAHLEHVALACRYPADPPLLIFSTSGCQ